MTGPEHYKEAESLMGLAAEARRASETTEFATWLTAQAQVHATLALTAATADLCTGRTGQAWAAALTDTGGTQ